MKLYETQTNRLLMKTEMTFQNPCGLLICGSSLFAIDAALSAAAGGRRVVLAMERTNPFIECIPGLRSHVSSELDFSVSPIMKEIIALHSTGEENNRIYFNPHAAAKLIEDRLIEAGVNFYYNAVPVSALMKQEGIGGAVFGGKPGLFAIEANEVWDCTLNSVIALTAGVPVEKTDEETRACYSIELSDNYPEQSVELDDDEISGKMRVHRFFADFEFVVRDPGNGPLGYAQDFNKIYDVSMKALDQAGYKRFRGADVYLHSGNSRIRTELGRIDGFAGFTVFGPMSIPENSAGQCAMTNPLVLHEEFGIPSPISRCSELPANATEYHIGPKAESEGNGTYVPCSFTDPDFDAPDSEKRNVEIGDNIETIERDLLIAGCGTSGAAAAFHAGRLGLDPLCIDGALEIGGTVTVGGVTNLWYGNKTRAFEDFYHSCGAENDQLNAWPFWYGLRKQGVEMLLSTPLCGTSWQDRKLNSAYVITPEGLLRIKAKQFIDATGDGSLAAWSGNEYTYGSERDGMSCWGSFGNFIPGEPEARRQFLSMVDERSVADATRFIVAMRRTHAKQLDSHPYIHPAFYIAPRTTRHIKGRKSVTYEDMLAGRRFKDTVLRCKSNIDTKGTETSNAFKAGFYPYERLAEFEVSIPYSALIPVDFDNLIITGKAYSITNDALTMARMQRDLFVLGMVASEAVNISNVSGNVLPGISVAALQENLIKIGALQKCDISDDDFGFPHAEELVNELITCKEYKESLEISSRLLVLGKETVLPILENCSFEMAPTVARLLCFWKVDSGITEIREDLERDFNGKGLLSEFYSNNLKAHMLPDHGFAPMSVLKLNNLALAGDPSVSRFIELVSDRFEEIVNDYSLVWSYTFGLAYAAERTASDKLVESLEKILENPIFAKNLISFDGDLRECADTERERYTYLRLCVGRALARCGSLKGIECLIEFLEESRASMAINARKELEEITGQQYGYSRQDWKNCLKQNPGIFAPLPVIEEFK